MRVRLSMRQIFYGLTSGWLLATGFAWFAGQGLNSTVVYQHEPLLDIDTCRPGLVVRWHSEGNGRTVMGRFNVSQISDLRDLDTPVIAIWGDSYVEALHIHDSHKVSAVLTSLLARAGIDATAASIGMSGWNVGHHKELMPKYQSLCDISNHFIVLGQINDILPGPDSYQVLPETVEFTPKFKTFGFNTLRRFCYEARAEFLWALIRDSRTSLRSMRFLPGPTAGGGVESPAVEATVSKDTLTSMLRSVDEVASGPLTFVHLPYTPRIEDGAIALDDPDRALASLFAEACDAADVGFLDMAPHFKREYLENGNFSRGFENTKLGEGHLNEVGNRLLAEAIAVQIQETTHAVHPD